MGLFLPIWMLFMRKMISSFERGHFRLFSTNIKQLPIEKFSRFSCLFLSHGLSRVDAEPVRTAYEVIYWVHRGAIQSSWAFWIPHSMYLSRGIVVWLLSYHQISPFPPLSAAWRARHPQRCAETETALFRETKRNSRAPQFRPEATQISVRNFAQKHRPNFEKNFAKLL